MTIFYGRLSVIKDFLFKVENIRRWEKIFTVKGDIIIVLL